MKTIKKTKLLSVWLKRAGAFVYGFIFGGLLLVGGLVAVSGLNIPGGYKLYTVQSGSMEPTLHTGSIVTVQPQKDYQNGDIVTIRESPASNVTLTHRIVEVKTVDGRVQYVTRGDANKANDPEERPKTNVVGKEIATVPYLGYILSYAKTKNGLLFLIIIPCVILIYNELLSIKTEALRLVHARKKKLTHTADKGLNNIFHRIRLDD